MGIATQEFRDGAATGAALVAKRARAMIGWGVTVDDRVLDKLAEGVVYEFGGRVFIDPEDIGGTTPTTTGEHVDPEPHASEGEA